MEVKMGRTDQTLENIKKVEVSIGSTEYNGIMLTEIAVSLALISDLMAAWMIKAEKEENDE